MQERLGWVLHAGMLGSVLPELLSERVLIPSHCPACQRLPCAVECNWVKL